MVASVRYAKTDEPMEMPFGMCTHGATRDHVFGGIPDVPTKSGTFGGHTGACPDTIFSTLFTRSSSVAACGYQ